MMSSVRKERWKGKGWERKKNGPVQNWNQKKVKKTERGKGKRNLKGNKG